MVLIVGVLIKHSFFVNNILGDVMLRVQNRYDRYGNKIKKISDYEPQYTEELCEFLDEIYSSGHSDYKEQLETAVII